jgi:hypothetical protein
MNEGNTMITHIVKRGIGGLTMAVLVSGGWPFTAPPGGPVALRDPTD